MFTKLHAPVTAVLLGASLLAAPAYAQDTYAERADRFGHALGRGDFNGDGRLDLAVGVPYEGVIVAPGQQVQWAGAVEVVYGAANGLSAANRQMWRQGLAGVNDVPEENDVFGWSLAAADFNQDGFDDLAVGVPGEDVNGVMDAGAVNVIFGSPQGLSTAYLPGQFWHQDQAGVFGFAEPFDIFGLSLAAGDFDGDGYGDLAIGVRGQSSSAGAVHLFYGGPTGLSYPRNRVFIQGLYAMADVAEPDDYFAGQLAAGDFNGDGYDDLAVGVPGENSKAGAVQIIYGRSTGLDAIGNQVIHQDSPGMYDVSEPGDRFGLSLATGDFNGDGFDDLAVGVPYETFWTVQFDGAVAVVYGTSSGLSPTLSQFWSQGDSAVEDNAEYNDVFGYAITSGDFNGDGCDDLVIGTPFEDIAFEADGAVNVLYGTSGGLWPDAAVPDQLWHQNVPGVPGDLGMSVYFGWALTAGDFNGDGRDDLAIGAPWMDLSGADGTVLFAGGVIAIYGSASGLGRTTVKNAPRFQLWTQTVILPPL